MSVAGLARTSTVDFPGRLSAVVFFNGCNYDCFYCHNRALIAGDAPGLPPSEVELFLQKRADVLDGVVVSGGEAAMQRRLPDFLRFCKRLGYETKLDTNGSLPNAVRALLEEGLLDYAAVDWKAPKRLYKDVCGENADPEKVLETIEILLASGLPFEVRTTVYPGLGEHLPEMAGELPALPRYVLNGYRRPESCKPEDEARASLPPYTREEMAALLEKVKKLQPGAVLGTE